MPHPLSDLCMMAQPSPMKEPKGLLYIQDGQQKLIKTLHLLASVSWMGGAFSLLVLAALRESSRYEPDVVRVINMCIYYVDCLVVLPGVIGCLLTGLVYSVYTPFGFVKYFWIAYKWLISLSAFFWGTLFLGPWAEDVFALAEACGVRWLLDFIHNCVMPQTSWGAYAQIVMLSSVVLVSVYRPVCLWNWYDYQQLQPRGLRHGRR